MKLQRRDIITALAGVFGAWSVWESFTIVTEHMRETCEENPEQCKELKGGKGQ